MNMKDGFEYLFAGINAVSPPARPYVMPPGVQDVFDELTENGEWRDVTVGAAARRRAITIRVAKDHGVVLE